MWSPWIAVHRPIEFQMKPWRAMELLIWDPRLCGHRTSPYQFLEDELTETRRGFLKFTLKNGNAKGSALPLERAWLGPFHNDTSHHSADLVDYTPAWLDQLASTVRQRVLPSIRRIPSSGWKALNLETRPGGRAISAS